MPKTILGFVFGGMTAFVLGLFILPQKVELIRFVDIEARPEKVWQHIVDVQAWDAWDPWEGKAQGDKRPWKEGSLSIHSVDPDTQEIIYKIDALEGEGDISLAVKPAQEGTVLRWRHSYVGGYWPWDRVPNWLNRSSLSLQLDEGLKKLKKEVEK